MDPTGIVATEIAGTAPGLLKEAFTTIKARSKKLAATLSGRDVESLQAEVAQLAEQIAETAAALESTMGNLERMERELAKLRGDVAYDDALFKEFWAWSQLGWWKRAFSRPPFPKEHLLRRSSGS